MTIDTAALRALLARVEAARYEGVPKAEWATACASGFVAFVREVPALLDALDAANAEIAAVHRLLLDRTGSTSTEPLAAIIGRIIDSWLGEQAHHEEHHAAAEARACTPAERQVIEAAMIEHVEEDMDTAAYDALSAACDALEAERLRGG